MTRSQFGQQLRSWRLQRGLSQLDLAVQTGTTPRHVSFLETGRSRPGRELVLRLADCLDIPVRHRNALLAAAGLPAEYAERQLTDAQLQPFRLAVEALLKQHEPYPGCAVDGLGQVQLANATFRALWPGLEGVSPEEGVDAFFGPGPMRELIENWAEVAWAYWATRQQDAARSNDPRLIALAERALRHLDGVERPPSSQTGAPVVCPRLRMGDRVIRTFTTVVRFEHPNEVTLSELRVELVFPMDDEAEAFFRHAVS